MIDGISQETFSRADVTERMSRLLFDAPDEVLMLFIVVATLEFPDIVTLAMIRDQAGVLAEHGVRRPAR